MINISTTSKPRDVYIKALDSGHLFVLSEETLTEPFIVTDEITVGNQVTCVSLKCGTLITFNGDKKVIKVQEATLSTVIY